MKNPKMSYSLNHELTLLNLNRISDKKVTYYLILRLRIISDTAIIMSIGYAM